MREEHVKGESFRKVRGGGEAGDTGLQAIKACGFHPKKKLKEL